MTMIIDRAQLSRAVDWVADAIPRKPEYVGHAALSFQPLTDDRVRIRAGVPGQVRIATLTCTDPLETKVPGRLLDEFLSLQSGSEIKIDIDGSTVVVSGSGKCRMPSSSAEVLLPEFKGDPVAVYDCGALDYAVSVVAKHVRPRAERVNDWEHAIIIGPDNVLGGSPYTTARVFLTAKEWNASLAETVLVDPLDLHSAIKGHDGLVEIGRDGAGLVWLRLDDGRVVGLAQVQCQAKPWDRVFGAKRNQTLTVEVAPMINAIRTASISADRIGIDAAEGEMTISSWIGRGVDKPDATASASVPYEGDAWSQVMSAEFLIKALTQVGETAVINWGTVTRGVMITDPHRSQEHIIQPIRTD